MVNRTLWLNCLEVVAKHGDKDKAGGGSCCIRVGLSSRVVGVTLKDWDWIRAGLAIVAVEKGGRCSCTSLLA